MAVSRTAPPKKKVSRTAIPGPERVPSTPAAGGQRTRTPTPVSALATANQARLSAAHAARSLLGG
uniref:Uncharacterized protein n=1 Tax=Triticum urartu TaxID=4572 RepID=A0A8R7PUF2_TRIUA